MGCPSWPQTSNICCLPFAWGRKRNIFTSATACMTWEKRRNFVCTHFYCAFFLNSTLPYSKIPFLPCNTHSIHSPDPLSPLWDMPLQGETGGRTAHTPHQVCHTYKEKRKRKRQPSSACLHLYRQDFAEERRIHFSGGGALAFLQDSSGMRLGQEKGWEQANRLCYKEAENSWEWETWGLHLSALPHLNYMLYSKLGFILCFTLRLDNLPCQQMPIPPQPVCHTYLYTTCYYSSLKWTSMP